MRSYELRTLAKNISFQSNVMRQNENRKKMGESVELPPGLKNIQGSQGK
jgi:hypothetical protein